MLLDWCPMKTPLWRFLDDIRCGDAACCGNKAANLGELAASGHAVPAGIVLTTDAFDAFLACAGLQALVTIRADETLDASVGRLVCIEKEIAELFAASQLPPDIVDAVRRWTGKRDGRRFVVRSCATNEDQVGATFAGLYRSVVGVSGIEIPEMVVKCFASLFSARAGQYRRRRRIAGLGSMAVMVQELVESDCAGVVFTRAPRQPDCLLIECAPGFADPVVSGSVAPSRYYLDRSTFEVARAVERHNLNPVWMPAIGREALAIEAEFGGSQDIEFGIGHGTVQIFQARAAIT